jgi:hypothetical protein
MGFIPYICQKCGGGERRCATNGHTEKIDTATEKEIHVPCKGSNMCYEDDCVLVPYAKYDPKLHTEEELNETECIPYTAYYNGYGRFEIASSIPWEDACLTVASLYDPDNYWYKQFKTVIYCTVWCKSCY